MSRKNDRERQWTSNECSSGKRAFYTRRDARQIASAQRRNGNERINVYRCDECKKFHLGHLPPPVVRGEVARAEIHQPVNRKRRTQT